MTKPDGLQDELSRRVDAILERPSTARENYLTFYYGLEQVIPWLSIIAFQAIVVFKSNFSIISLILFFLAFGMTLMTFAVGFFMYDKANLTACVNRLQSFPQSTTLSPVCSDRFSSGQNPISEFIDKNFRKRTGSEDSPDPKIFQLNGPPRLFFRAFQFFPRTHPCVIFLSGDTSRIGGPQKFFLWHEIAHSHDFMILEDSMESMLLALQVSLAATILVQQPTSWEGLGVAASAILFILTSFFLFKRRRRHVLLREEIFADSLAIGMLNDRDMKQCTSIFKRGGLLDNDLPGHYSQKRNEALQKNLRRWSEVFDLSEGYPQPAYFGVLLFEYLKSNRFKLDVWMLPASGVLCGFFSGPTNFTAFVLVSVLFMASLTLTFRLYSEHQALVERLKLELKGRSGNLSEASK